jgi:hypothetical protein
MMYKTWVDHELVTPNSGCLEHNPRWVRCFLCGKQWTIDPWNWSAATPQALDWAITASQVRTQWTSLGKSCKLGGGVIRSISWTAFNQGLGQVSLSLDPVKAVVDRWLFSHCLIEQCFADARRVCRCSWWRPAGSSVPLLSPQELILVS